LRGQHTCEAGHSKLPCSLYRPYAPSYKSHRIAQQLSSLAWSAPPIHFNYAPADSDRNTARY